MAFHPIHAAMHTPKDEKDDPVWDLLKEARPIKPSSFFSRNVVREVRKTESERSDSAVSALLDWFRQPAIANTALAALAVAAVAVIAFKFQAGSEGLSASEAGDPGSVAQAVVSPAPSDSENALPTPGAPASDVEYDPANEIENLSYLGELMAVADPAMLNDDALADLLF